MKKVIFDETTDVVSVKCCTENYGYIALMGNTFYILKREPSVKQYRWFSFEDTRSYYGNSRDTIKEAISLIYADGATVFQFSTTLELLEFIHNHCIEEGK